MKNTLVDIQNQLMEMLETLNDTSLKGDDLDTHIKRSLAANELAKTMVANGALMVKTVDTFYGIDTNYQADMDDLPLIPGKKGEPANRISTDKKPLLAFPKGKGKKGVDEEWADQM